MNALSLFSGIGGIDLACEWAGIKTVAMCEREPFCQKVLRKHWPDVTIYDDVCTLTKERLESDGIGTIDIIFSGDPCQPYSHAGKREGEGDDRFLCRKLIAYWNPSDPAGLCAKMLLETSLWASTMCLLTWKTSATPGNRLLFQLQPSVPHKEETEFSLWPTPKATIRGDCPSERRRNSPDLPSAVKMWPTPRANDAEKKGNINCSDPRNGLPAAVGIHSQGQLNPNWVESLMGFPDDWTNIDGHLIGESNSKNGSSQGFLTA